MKTPEEGEREKKFQDLARSAHAYIFEKGGDTAADKILDHVIDADGKLWKALQSQLARHGALVLIKALMKRSPYVKATNSWTCSQTCRALLRSKRGRSISSRPGHLNCNGTRMVEPSARGPRQAYSRGFGNFR